MKSIRIIISFFLCLTLLLGLSASIIEVSATQSSDKFNKKYTLTGNGADDMVNIALAQEGKTGSEFGYSEQWCSDFVSDCAKLAGQSEAVPFNGNQINLRAAILKAGGTVTTSSPKAGDICFIDWTASGKEAGHVEIVYQVLNGAVYTIGGNTGSGNNLYTRYVKKHAPLPQKYISSIVRPKYSSNAPTTAPTDPFITASATIVAVNEEVTFNYGATNATWYRFGSFRNGELTVTEVWSNTSHTTSFSEAGVYIIHVQCMNKIGFVDSEDIVITVYDSAPTDPFITATATTVAVNEEVTFNYGATNATWYRFGSFRNGELSVTEVWSNTSHTTSFSEAGVYIIHVQCMNKIGFVDSEDIVITVYDSAPTDPFITATATTVAVNEEVTFNYGATNATWYRFGSFRNGELSVTEVWSNTSHTTSFSEAGVYIIHVQCMNKIGFVDSEDIVITVYDSAPTDPFITATATTVAVNEEVTFNYGATNATWYRFGSFRNGELSVTEVWSNTSHTTSFSEAGVYIIHVQCMNKIGFVDSEDIVVTVYIPNAIVKIELNAVGGDCSISEISVNDSLPIGALPIPIRNGYNFDGWYTAASGGTKVTEETIFSANTTLYAHWSACDHNYTVIESVDSSCTKEGSKTLKCTKCGNTYNEKIEKKAHTAVIDNAVAVTCTTAGLTEGSHCSTCGAVIKARTTVPPTGHTDMNNDGLCDKCGKSLAPTAYPKLSIRTPSTATVSYGFTLNLHANVTDLPEGARIVWSMNGSGFELIPSADGMTCGVKSVSKGSATITAKVVDKNGNAVKDANGNEITASQQLTSKAGFFQKIAAFFKKLFGSNMVIPSSLNKLIK